MYELMAGDAKVYSTRRFISDLFSQDNGFASFLLKTFRLTGMVIQLPIEDQTSYLLIYPHAMTRVLLNEGIISWKNIKEIPSRSWIHSVFASEYCALNSIDAILRYVKKLKKDERQAFIALLNQVPDYIKQHYNYTSRQQLEQLIRDAISQLNTLYVEDKVSSNEE